MRATEDVLRPLWDELLAIRIGQKSLLVGTSWVAGSLAVLLLFCALSMDSWLFTVEREPDEASNGTYLITLHSGLWRVCKKHQYLNDVGKNTQWNLSWREYPAIFCVIPLFTCRPTSFIFYRHTF
ncbi:unnamed protein product [Mesocestoides corti]|uniref:Dolichyl-diphosphooligosaccharide--protein glycotransferase n=1 Tax=Mesocestoides corti TaxID=53468 RepID=A0A0R3UHH4_MESCO|nr:unnamed protein product [Mesocestoides corti]